MKIPKTFIGIDYGKKNSGNTVICYKHEERMGFAGTEKNQDPDPVILEQAEKLKAEYIFLDAPLSIPKVYYNPSDEEHDYFYRKCDRDLCAMSPMFIGGLTARAIRLKHQLEDRGFIVKEVYPAALARLIDLKKHGYKENTINIVRCLDVISSMFHIFNLREEEIPTWHHFDALLALISGGRYLQGVAKRYGNSGEGLIYV
jgi:predicted nuclease with RNAse H fold